MKRDKSIVGVVLLGCAIVSGSCQVSAQPLPMPEQATTRYNYYRIPLRNVPPDLMAWWLDPEHNAKPEMIVESERVMTEFFRRPGQPARDVLEGQNTTQQVKATNQEKPRRGLFALPDEVELMVPVPSQKALLVRATAEGAAKLKTIVKYLDMPLRQVEVEAQFVAVNREGAKTFGATELDLDTDGGVTTGGQAIHYKPQFSFGFLSRNYHATLDTLMRAGKAQVVASHHFVTINNLSVSFTSETHLTDVRIEAKSQAGQVVAALGAPSPASSSPYFLATRYKLTLTPTINNDDTVTIRVQPRLNSVLTNQAGSGETPVGEEQSIDMTAIVQDGDTIVLSGLDNEALDKLGNPHRQIMIFITPHMVQPLANRTEEDAAQPQTVEPKPVQP